MSHITFCIQVLKFLILIFNIYLVLQAAYNVGGHVVSADVIQNSILGCKMSRPGQVHSESTVSCFHIFPTNVYLDVIFVVASGFIIFKSEVQNRRCTTRLCN